MTWLDFVTAALATWQAVAVWRHSSLFATRRATLQAEEGSLSELAACGWCLSIWVAWWACLWVAAADLAAVAGHPWLAFALKTPLYGLAASRLANAAHDLHERLAPRKETDGE